MATDQWTWREAAVDVKDAHFELRCGTAAESNWDDWLPVALVGRPAQRIFPVRFLIDRGDIALKKVVEDVSRELNLYLIELQEPDPWVYAQYHCGTASNLYSSIHWSFFERSSA